jgi:hypothetical protein
MASTPSRTLFVNEIDTASRDFISRYVLVQLIPDGNRDIEAGTDHEAELAKVEDKMKEVCGDKSLLCFVSLIFC